MKSGSSTAEPVILRTVMPDDYRYGHVYGYTRKHMEAYADARVREALEAAAEQWDGCIYDAAPGGDIDIGAAIRRLIPQQ